MLCDSYQGLDRGEGKEKRGCPHPEGLRGREGHQEKGGSEGAGR